ncbi:hypothetical protein PR001_g28123 [Phytophthora rubi]|uniref:Retrotransposon gag domain-containing protein n=1 Tax=Phytophthora rubi TaxID=129364 RepID=A0A6A3HEM8_9STRA|nr:hypothetical protein PR001_g28123 [Phytophthora rubi]
MSDAQRRTQVEQRQQLEALERLAEQRVAAETEKRKEDETRAQYLLGVQKKLQEADIRARQEELQRIHDERTAKTRAEHDVELLRLKEEHAQAQAAHERAVAEREEKLRQLLIDQERLRAQADSQNQPSHSTSSQDLPRTPAESSVILTVIDPVLAKLDRLTDVMHQMVQANQRQAEKGEPRDKTTKAQSSSQNGRTKSSARTSSSASRRSTKTRTSRSKRPDDDDWGSDSTSSSDSSQDELEGHFGVAAQSKRSDAVSGTRVVVQAMIPHDALEKFDERGPLDDRVNWWERFMYYATMAPWDEKTRIVQLRMRLSGSLKDWCAQLPDSTRSDWKKLSHVFKKEWYRSIGSKAERYYAMEIRESETPRMFLYRLNRAAKTTDIAFERPTTEGEAHVRRFIKALSDSRLKTTLQGQRFDTLSELEETLKRIEALRQDERHEDRDYQPKKRPTQNLQFGRFKPQPRRGEGRAFMADSTGMDAEAGRQVHFSEEDFPRHEAASEAEQAHQAMRAEAAEPQPSSTAMNSLSTESSYSAAVTDEDIFRVAERLVWKPKTDAQPFGRGTLQREEFKCSECGSKRHNTENCWSKLICGRCHDEGHPTQYCKRQPCSKCGGYHRRGLCDMWAALKTVRETIRAGGSLESIDPETIRQLLDGSDPETPLNH